MNQHNYIQDLITLFGLEDTSSVDTMEVNVKYRKDEGDLLDRGGNQAGRAGPGQ